MESKIVGNKFILKIFVVKILIWLKRRGINDKSKKETNYTNCFSTR